jgi:hypothetical protein
MKGHFEGEVVDGGYEILIRQYKGQIDKPLTLDETFELNVHVKVMSVAHEVQKKNGTMARVHIVHVQEVETGQEDE